MDDLIKREDALKAIVDERTHTLLQAWINVKKTVPSIDAIEVVRCKGCKYERDGEEFMWCEHPSGLDSIVKPDDYCSYGERRES